MNNSELEQRLRTTLNSVAATVSEAPQPKAVRSAYRPRRRMAYGIGAALAAVPLAAAAVVGFGPEHVDRVPPANPIISGIVGDEKYWIVDGRESPKCENSPSGIEVIAEDSNIVGQEWNTVGYFFGEPTKNWGCAPTSTNEPASNTYYYDGGQEVGDGMLWAGALHTDIDEVKASFDNSEFVAIDTFKHEGSEYFALEIPSGTSTFTIEYLVDGQVLTPPTGETAQHSMANR